MKKNATPVKENWSTKFKRILQTMAILLSIQGLITFSLFICEEALQTTTFGTWPAQDAGDWSLVLDGVDLLENINFGMKIINYSVGWIQPLAFFSYRSYSKATDYYIKGLKAKAFARAPQVFNSRKVEFTFEPQRMERYGDKIHYINRNIVVVGTELLSLQCGIKVSGIVRLAENGKTVFVEEAKMKLSKGALNGSN
ncbi:MAG: hypothetical protein KJ888_21020 [Gammaproteobacteria bacterium]|uniref:Uncharacterized protein n=1 Tax=viral metagenome TaxID=1070528 RepID=A0A6M3L3B4_9ZZZZ|nr:hypothetical protein [Gammaproteobacteria bacterium]